MPNRACRRATALVEGLERRLCFATLYVAPGGLDVYPGTQSSPLASLAGAAAIARAGDLVLVMAGTYSPTQTQRLSSIGAADGHVVFEPYPGQTVVIDGSGIVGSGPVVDITGTYIDFQNFQVQHGHGADLQVTGTHIQVISNNFVSAQGQGVLIGSGTSLTNTADVSLVTNYILNDALAAASAPPGAALGPPGATAAPLAAAQTDGASNVRFTGNYIHDNFGAGLDLLLLNGGDMSANVIHDNVGANVELDNTTQVTLEQNFIYNTSETQFYTNGSPAVSIELTNGKYAFFNPLNGDRIQNNIVLFGSINLQYTYVGAGVGMQGMVIANNDFYAAFGPDGVNLWIDASTGNANNLIADNIFDQPASGTQTKLGANASTGGQIGVNFENNNWFEGSQSFDNHGGAGVAANPGDVYSDPLLSNPGSIDPAAYKLPSNSPDVDAAIPVTGVVNDYYNIPRPQGKLPDIGAHEVVLGVTQNPGGGGAPPPTGTVGVPAGIVATAPNPYEIDLTWGDEWGNISGFAIQRRGTNGWMNVGFAGVGPPSGQYYAITSSFADTGLKPNHRYVYRIFGFFLDNTVTHFSAKVTFKTPKAPKAPKAPKPQKVHKPVKPATKRAVAIARRGLVRF